MYLLHKQVSSVLLKATKPFKILNKCINYWDYPDLKEFRFQGHNHSKIIIHLEMHQQARRHSLITIPLVHKIKRQIFQEECQICKIIRIKLKHKMMIGVILIVLLLIRKTDKSSSKMHSMRFWIQMLQIQKVKMMDLKKLISETSVWKRRFQLPQLNKTCLYN